MYIILYELKHDIGNVYPNVNTVKYLVTYIFYDKEEINSSFIYNMWEWLFYCSLYSVSFESFEIWNKSVHAKGGVWDLKSNSNKKNF